MVRNPVCAEPWQPICFVRQQMLAHSYSFLPVHFQREGDGELVSDLAIAKYLRESPAQRYDRLKKSLQDAVLQDDLKLTETVSFRATEPIPDVVAKMERVPVLIHSEQNRQTLVGILTAFDLL